MRIIALTYERGWELEKDHDIFYADINGISELGWDEAAKRLLEFEPDIVIEREFNDGKALYMPLLYRLKKAKPDLIITKWFIDTHLQKRLHQMYAGVVDVGFFALSRCADEFEDYMGEGNAFWLPLCYPYRSDTINKNYNEIKYPLSFVGRWGKTLGFMERTDYIHKLHKMYGSKFHSVTDYDNMLSIIKRSKVTFNHSIGDDLNFRVFEALGCGTELVTNDVPDLHKVKGLTDYLTIYSGSGGLYAAIEAIWADDPAFTHNMLKAQDFIKEKHTMKNRLNSILEMVESRQQQEF